MKRLDMPFTALNNGLVKPEPRPRFVAVRLTLAEGKVVEDLAEETGLSMSDIIRQALRLTYAPRFKRIKKRRHK
jgi:hypothetical protein